MNKTILIIIAVAVIVGGASFYGGIQYANNARASQVAAFRNGTGTGGGQRGGAGTRAGGGFTAGDIIAKDDKSITVKLQNGGSKIIFFSTATQIEKFVSGSTTDLAIGKTVTINGQANSDGSINAQSIQIRPLPTIPTNQQQ